MQDKQNPPLEQPNWHCPFPLPAILQIKMNMLVFGRSKIICGGKSLERERRKKKRKKRKNMILRFELFVILLVVTRTKTWKPNVRTIAQ